MNRRITIAWTALAVVVLALAVADLDRGWKRLQADFRERELAHLRTELDAVRHRSADASAALGDELERARERFAARRDDVRRLERRLARARHAASWAEDELARLRQGVARPDDEAARDARRRLEERRREELELTEQLSELTGELEDLEARWEAAARRPQALARRITELERGGWWRRLPVLRGLAPTLEVVEDTPPGLPRPTPAGQAPRVDRCRTCHLRSHESSIDDAAPGNTAAWPSPFGAHPGRLVGDGMLHPASRFGCTVCHGGEGRATDFSRAGHWPTSAEQEAAWAEKWGYERGAVPAAAILPSALVEAGCAPCHVSLSRTNLSHPGAAPRAAAERASLDRGRRLVVRMGCGGCHAGGGDAERPGPPLDRLAVKTTPGWAFHWISAPRRFRPTTWMPHLVPGAADEARRTAEIRAMVHYLWSRSGGEAYDDPPAGDADAGGELFAAVGCTGCHLLDAAASRDGAAFGRLHGPNLARTGNKVRAGWLYAWLLDPRSHRPDTPMPDLRLSAGEAADLTAFLMASRDPAWERLELPPADPGTRDELVRELLEQELTLAASASRLAAMSADDKELYLGRRSLEAYGCHGCHEVPGLAEAPPVASPLGITGHDPRRWLQRLDDAGGSAALLAHRPRPGARAAPDYDWSRGEADAVLVALLGRAPVSAEPWRRAEQGERARALAAGRRLLTRYGCLGCHRLGADGGAIAATLDGPGPPELTSAGARLQPSWLYAYLREPAAYARRPWLTVRMPTFHLRPEETYALVRYFAARDREPLFAMPVPEPAKVHVEVGRAVAAMLQCHSCHLEAGTEQRPRELAPSYRGVRERLRPRWVVEWILDPRRFVTDPVMPVPFPRDAGGAPDASYLKATVSSPMFNDQRERLLPYFESEQELLDYLDDAPRVARALRDYLWSLE